MISIIEREIVDKYHWLERDEFLDLLAIAQSMPGILAVNISVVVGDKLRGLKGSINPTLSAIFKGIRPVVVALIIAPVFTTARSAGIGLKTAWIPAVVALFIWSKWPVVSNPILYIVLGALVGWYLTARSHKLLNRRKDNKQQ